MSTVPYHLLYRTVDNSCTPLYGSFKRETMGDDDVDGGTPQGYRKKPTEQVTTLLGSSMCHCFSSSFIELYRRFITDINSEMCFVLEGRRPCGNQSEGGAHVISTQTVMILPACANHNKPNSDEKYYVRDEYCRGEFGLVLQCCCYNTRGLDCRCKDCKAREQVCACQPKERVKCNCTT